MKKCFFIIAILSLMLTSYGCVRKMQRSLFDYPESKWECQQPTVVIYVDISGESKAVLKKDGKEYYLTFTERAQIGRVSLSQINEEEFRNGVSVIDHTREVLGGSYQISDRSYIVTSEGDFNSVFWGVEDDEKLELIFERVDTE